MKPFFTLLLESFRGLKSQLIFWITLGLSILMALIFLSIGFDDKGMTFFFGMTGFEEESLRKGSPGARFVYMSTFTNVVAGIWLTWIAIILALISCAPIFPNTMTEGGAGMVMTKGVSRLHIFIAKFLGSLFFVAIQVGFFVIIVFWAFKWRLGEWNFTLFWFVPAVLLVFVSLYSFLVFVAVKTRSVLTAFLLTILVWAISGALGWTESVLRQQIEQPEIFAMQVEDKNQESWNSDAGVVVREKPEANPTVVRWHKIVRAIHTPFPKNGPIMAAAEKKLVFDGAKGLAAEDQMSEEDQEEMEKQLSEISSSEASFYSIWSSLLFSVVMLALAARSFCRRDY